MIERPRQLGLFAIRPNHLFDFLKVPGFRLDLRFAAELLGVLLLKSLVHKAGGVRGDGDGDDDGDGA